MCFVINGQRANRYDAMRYIVTLAWEGLSMPQILDAAGSEWEHYPTAREVDAWRRLHPDFDEELKRSEKYRAEILVEEGLSTIRNAGPDENGIVNRDMVTYAKTLNEAFVQSAGFLNDKFTTKTKVQTENISSLSEEEAGRKLAELVKADPSLFISIPGIKEALQETSVQTLECKDKTEMEGILDIELENEE